MCDLQTVSQEKEQKKQPFLRHLNIPSQNISVAIEFCHFLPSHVTYHTTPTAIMPRQFFVGGESYPAIVGFIGTEITSIRSERSQCA
jgi:hypothetical protein